MSLFKLNHVTFKYHGSNKPALEDISISIHQNECVLILGHEDAGKSTLGMILKGLIPEFNLGSLQGEILLNNEPLSSLSSKEMVTRIGYLFKDPKSQLSMLKETVIDEITFVCENLNYDRGETLFRVKAMARLCDLSTILNDSIFTCSLGTLQKVALASMLVLDPDIMIFDEPLTHLDYSNQAQFIKLCVDLKKQGKTIIILDHSYSVYESLVDQVIHLEDGRIITSGLLKDVYNHESRLFASMLVKLVNDVKPHNQPIISLEDAILALQGEKTHD
jgi:energy-coupling factor transporter ATP-binding protein EcfA2